MGNGVRGMGGSDPEMDNGIRDMESGDPEMGRNDPVMEFGVLETDTAVPEVDFSISPMVDARSRGDNGVTSDGTRRLFASLTRCPFTGYPRREGGS